MGMTTVLNVSGLDKERFLKYTEEKPATYEDWSRTWTQVGNWLVHALDDRNNTCRSTFRKRPARRTILEAHTLTSNLKRPELRGSFQPTTEQMISVVLGKALHKFANFWFWGCPRSKRPVINDKEGRWTVFIIQLGLFYAVCEVC